MSTFQNSGVLIVISGPAGSGKTTVAEALVRGNPNIHRVVTATTRTPRLGEQTGVDYHFLGIEDFERKIEEGAFYEWALVHGRYYGTPKSSVDDLLAIGKDLILVIDVQGAQAFRMAGHLDEGLAKRLRTVFLKPESLEVLTARMSGRGEIDPEEIRKRLKSAEKEMAEASKFDFVITTTTREKDLQQVQAIYDQARRDILSGLPSVKLPIA